MEFGHLFYVVKFAVKSYQEALSMLETVSDDSASKYCMKSTNCSQLTMAVDGSAFSVC